MQEIQYIDRVSGKICQEKVFAGGWLRLMYGDSLFSRGPGRLMAKVVAGSPWISRVAGWYQRRSWTRRQISRFVKDYTLDTKEFADEIDSFANFNAFFCRRLREEVRPIANGEDVAIIPADGRYRFFPNVSENQWFDIKGRRLSLAGLLQDESLAKLYREGTLVLARLCPTDYHRFHFPVDSLPGSSYQIPGTLFSVNPWALRQKMDIFSQNRRQITQLSTKEYGKVLMVEIGATCVGTIHQTFIPGQPYRKGAEKGYFSFGGSALALLFEPERLQLAHDLQSLSGRELEIRCLMGQPLGHLVNPLRKH